VSRGVLLKRMALCMLAGLAFGLVISEASFHFLNSGQTRPPETIQIDIPPGTAADVLQGKSDPSLPSSLTFVLGDTLSVKNGDSVTHQLGPLLIPPGTTASMMLDSVQNYAVSCSFEPSKYIGLNVQPPLTIVTRVVGVLEAGIPMGFLLVLYVIFAVPPPNKVASA
jgi:hypothetical protein